MDNTRKRNLPFGSFDGIEVPVVVIDGKHQSSFYYNFISSSEFSISLVRNITTTLSQLSIWKLVIIMILIIFLLLLPVVPTITTSSGEKLTMIGGSGGGGEKGKGNKDIYRRHYYSYIYQPRGKLSSDKEKQQQQQQQHLATQWGSWWKKEQDDDDDEEDEDEKHTRNHDPVMKEELFLLYETYPNRDIPSSKFSSTTTTTTTTTDTSISSSSSSSASCCCWQCNTNYLKKFLTEGQELVDRAMEAILTEYGHGLSNYNTLVEDEDEQQQKQQQSLEERSSMFALMLREELMDDNETTTTSNNNNNNGGWTTPLSWEGLKRRLLHAIMTEGTFIVAMAGNGVAAGVGNHFQQSYILQVQWIMEPIFARLGVRHESRNFGNPGLGTLHNAMGSSSIFGPDLDLLIWDCESNEPEDRAVDLLARQTVLGGIKVPVLWNFRSNVSQTLHNLAKIDVGSLGTALSGIPLTTTQDELDQTIWAARYVNCANETRTELCRRHEFNGTCWIQRPDFYPPKGQASTLPHSSYSVDEDYPGNRHHQLRGRIIAFMLLKALQEVLTIWREAEGFILPDEAWHVTEYYETLRTNVRSLDPSMSGCGEMKSQGLGFLCKYPFQARTEFTPRAYPEHSSIRSIMPPAMLAKIEGPKPNLYAAPDVFNPHLYPPDGEVDVLSIVENGGNFSAICPPLYTDYYKKALSHMEDDVTLYQTPGDGVSLFTYAGDHQCDGTLDSFCNRGADNACLLSGHNHGRGGLRFDSTSGWVVMIVPKLKFGYIVVKLESWHRHGDAVPGLNPSKYHPNNPLCIDFRFEYSIDGHVTSLNHVEFKEKKQDIQHLVETITVLKDPDYIIGGKERDVEVAIRMTGCDKQNVFLLTHIYWA